MTLSHPVAVITSDEQALIVASDLAEDFRRDSALRDREWQVSTQPALAQAPTLVLSYRPERFVMLAQGEGPYVLVGGSGRATREDYPVQAALAASSTAPQPATLGARSEAGGPAALGPERGADWQRWVLWAVLAAGAGLVLVVSLKVLRQPKAS